MFNRFKTFICTLFLINSATRLKSEKSNDLDPCKGYLIKKITLISSNLVTIKSPASGELKL